MRDAVPGNRGLAGLRERVTVLGGTLRTGPFEGGFQVSATLPHHTTAQRPRPVTSEAADAQPESARRLAHMKRSTRRRFAIVFAVPAGAALFFLPAATYLAHLLATSVLPPSHYEKLRVGSPLAEIVRLLPTRPYPYPPRGRTLRTATAGNHG